MSTHVKHIIPSNWAGTLILVCGLILTACSPSPTPMLTSTPSPSLEGRWTFSVQVSNTCEGENPYDNWVIGVTQEGNTFYSDPANPPSIENGVIEGNRVSFQIILENDESVDKCGDFSELEGTLSGDTIRGTIEGHDCHNTCVWDGTFTVQISKE